MSQSECDAQPTKKFQFVAGNLALDFTNTVGGKRGVVAREMLHAYRDFLSWCRQAGLVDEAGAERLARKAVEEQGEAGAVLERARELREAIFRICAAAISGKTAEGADVERLNEELGRALCRRRVAASEHGFVWKWVSSDEALDSPLGPVAGAAAELMTNSELLDKVHQCNGEGCGWLFLDLSKNHSRRWCDMRDCGNRAKVRRHRLRHRTC